MRHILSIPKSPAFLINTVAAAILLGGALLPATHASADVITIGNPSLHGFFITTDNLEVRPGEFLNVYNASFQGGDLLGTLNGEALGGTYCANLTNFISLGETYDTTTVTYDGAVFGEPVNSAGAISWLMTNFASPTLSIDEQNGLQAAIWRVEYGEDFQVDGVDNANTGNINTAGMMTAYQNYLAAVGTNTAPVGDVLWISADRTSPIVPHAQGLVAVRAIPEPGSIAFVLAGGLPLIGLIAKRRRSS